MKTAIALSGGIDSSVAAYLLKQQGHDLIGVFMRFWHDQSPTCTGCVENKCCNKKSLQTIKRLCVKLNIPLKIFNFEKEFKKKVVDKFIKYYDQGLTPNPCIWCNEEIKFTLLYKKAKKNLNIDNIATGHYANIQIIDDYTYIKRGKDKTKDQSYFLYRLPQNIIKKTLFPVGYMTKNEVKKLATKHLPEFKFNQKKESQDLCFYPEDSYKPFISRYAKKLTKPGPIVNENNEIIGEHCGLVNYTIGQRKGLKIGGGPIYYVKSIDTPTNKLIVNTHKNILCDTISLKKPIITPQIQQKKSFKAQIRHGHTPTPCHIKLSKNKITLNFPKSQLAPTPGQHAVIYHQNIVVAGGEIAKY
ncbi:tRNA 2-thiouridine(34) synthase MnmA [Patescibacteria group bacterium]|nr:tRNA 2-thiouridine(34) synthase MnmA [Patescibacteria group bacterium]